jgi:RNA polymerase sigma-70 factor (ECF subfamily)
MTAIAARDTAAFDQLYRRYRPLAFATAHALLQEPADAEDATHDAFVRVWRAAATFQPTLGSLRSWLLTIVRNVALDLLRARQTAQRVQPVLAEIDGRERDNNAIPVAVVAADEARRVRAALQTLPPEQRRAVELAFVNGLTHGEIAARTGEPLGTVKGRVRLGLRRLRHELSEAALHRGPHAQPGLHAS